MSKKCSRLRWTMKLTSLGNEAYFVCQRSLLRLPTKPTSFANEAYFIFLWFFLKKND